MTASRIVFSMLWMRESRSLPGAPLRAQSGTLTTIYSFAGGPGDGSEPTLASLLGQTACSTVRRHGVARLMMAQSSDW